LLAATAVVVVSGAVVAGGCWLDVGRFRRESGDLVVQWRIDGRVDPDACAQHEAAQVAIDIRTDDERGTQADAFVNPACAAFSDTIRLEEGWYRADLKMFDGAGRGVSSTVTTDSFYVFRRRSVVVAVDFPVTAFSPLQ
jgi:hypothetical protein